MRCVLGVVVLVLAGGCESHDAPTGAGSGGTGGLSGGSGGSGGVPVEEPTAGTGGSGRPLPGQKRVFVTGSRYGADLKTGGRATEGLAGGDVICQTSAEAATLGGSWKAWLSTGVRGGDATAHAVDRLADVGPWYRTDGTKAFNNKANLRTSPLVPISYDENGQRVLDALEVWTGTAIGGMWTGSDCDQWTVGINLRVATMGRADSQTETWTEAMSAACGESHRLYCIEQ